MMVMTMTMALITHCDDDGDNISPHSALPSSSTINMMMTMMMAIIILHDYDDGDNISPHCALPSSHLRYTPSCSSTQQSLEDKSLLVLLIFSFSQIDLKFCDVRAVSLFCDVFVCKSDMEN